MCLHPSGTFHDAPSYTAQQPRRELRRTPILPHLENHINFMVSGGAPATPTCPIFPATCCVPQPVGAAILPPGVQTTHIFLCFGRTQFSRLPETRKKPFPERPSRGRLCSARLPHPSRLGELLPEEGAWGLVSYGFAAAHRLILGSFLGKELARAARD